MSSNMKDNLSGLEDSGMSCASVFVSAISDMVLSGKSNKDIATFFDVKESAVEFILNTPKTLSGLFCEYVNGRKAVTIDINYSKAIEVADEVVSFDNYKLKHISSGFEAKIAEIGYSTQMYRLLSQYLFTKHIDQNMSLLNDLASPSPMAKDIPREMAVVMSGMSILQHSIFVKGCFLNKVAKLKVDAKALEHCIAGFKPRADAIQLCLKLVRLGANYYFVNRYNNGLHVEFNKINKWRNIFGFTNETQKMRAVEATELWSKYHILIKGKELNSIDTCELYIDLHKVFKGKYTIETLYMQMSKLLQDEKELMDDSDVEDSDVISLLK